MRLRPYQKLLIDAVVADLSKGGEVCLAASPGAGKTLMAIHAIKRLLDSPKAERVLVLTHGQRVLRSQFASAAEAEGLFTSQEIGPGVEIDRSVQVLIGLPHSIHSRALPPIDLIIVDEAHEFYDAPMVQKIIKRIGAPVLALTGTPSPFVAKGSRIHAISLSELYDAGFASPVSWLLATSAYPLEYGDYNADGEVRKGFRYGARQTGKSLEGCLRELAGKVEVAANWPDVLRALDKTMFVCRSRAQAVQIVGHLKRKGVVALLSTGEDDADSGEMERFKRDATAHALVVVRRGSLGFDFPELVNLVDMTGTINVNRIFQMACRLARRHPSRTTPKLFVRLTSEKMAELTQAYTSGAAGLMEREALLSYNGRDLSGLRCIARVGEPKEAKEGEPVERGEGGGAAKPTAPEWMSLFDEFRPIMRGAGGFKAYAVRDLAKERVRLGAAAHEVDPSGKKQWAKDLWSFENRLPCSSDGGNYVAFVTYVTRGNRMFDPGLSSWARERGYGRESRISEMEDKKRRLRAMMSAGRLPPAGSPEFGWLHTYCRADRQTYDESIHRQATALGYGKRGGDKESSKRKIYEMWEREGRHPAPGDPLRTRGKKYIASGRPDDAEFLAWAKRTGWGYFGIAKRVEARKREILDVIAATGAAPKSRSQMGADYRNYIARGSESYDPDFRSEARALIESNRGACGDRRSQSARTCRPDSV